MGKGPDVLFPNYRVNTHGHQTVQLHFTAPLISTPVQNVTIKSISMITNSSKISKIRLYHPSDNSISFSNMSKRCTALSVMITKT